MLSRWGLEGMRSFEQRSVARKEKLGTEEVPLDTPDTINIAAEGGARLR